MQIKQNKSNTPHATLLAQSNEFKRKQGTESCIFHSYKKDWRKKEKRFLNCGRYPAMDTTAVRFIGKLRGESNKGWQPFISHSYAAMLFCSDAAFFHSETFHRSPSIMCFSSIPLVNYAFMLQT